MFDFLKRGKGGSELPSKEVEPALHEKSVRVSMIIM